MVDFHTHILPEIDDGSDSIETSVMMLGEMKKQGVETIVATPHFSPQNQSVADFLQRRQEAIEKINPHLNGIKLISAAEVKYCRNISKVEGIEKVAIGNSGYILIEMPYRDWDKQVVDDVISIIDNSGLVPILAHVDRYWNKETKRHFDRFLDAGMLLQLNVSSFDGFWEKRRFLKMIEEGRAHLLGSDCHNMTKRLPNLFCGFELLEKKGLVPIVEGYEAMVLESTFNVLTSKNSI